MRDRSALLWQSGRGLARSGLLGATALRMPAALESLLWFDQVQAVPGRGSVGQRRKRPSRISRSWQEQSELRHELCCIPSHEDRNRPISYVAASFPHRQELLVRGLTEPQGSPSARGLFGPAESVSGRSEG